MKYREAYGDFANVAVNISMRQLSLPSFAEQVMAILRQSGVPAGALNLEITESVLMSDVGGSVSRLSALRNYGIGISLDDFGTGYSSLGYISRFPLDKLKIDQSFVRAMITSQTNMAIVDTIIRLANNLHLRVIAEGVETDEELEALRDRKCDEVQGYLYARPMPAEELILWWKNGIRNMGFDCR